MSIDDQNNEKAEGMKQGSVANEPVSQEDNGQTSLKDVEEKLIQAQSLAEENLRGWQRAAADFENFKRRSEENSAGLVAYGQDQVILDFLQIIEDLERVLKYLPEAEKINQWRTGAESVHHRFEEVLKNLNVEKLKTVGEKFNPEYHEAVDMVPGGEKEVIAEEVAPGYRRGNRLLRSAQVRVYDGKQ